MTPQYVVLDANYLVADWRLTSLPSMLLRHMTWEYRWQVAIPQVALSEAAATFQRAVDEVETATSALMKKRRRLGFPHDLPPSEPVNYLDYMAELLDEKVLGFEILPVPEVGHADLIERAVHRRPPFDAKGSGYRDALIWASVVELVADGHEVVLASLDNDFAGPEGQLDASLAAEVAELKGTVVLVKNLGTWLIGKLPWESPNVGAALADANEREFSKYLMESDIVDGLDPPLDALTVPPGAISVDVDSTAWNGLLERVDWKLGPDGSMVVQFDIGLDVDIGAKVISLDRTSWHQVWETCPVTARFKVLFDSDGQWVDEVSYSPSGSNVILGGSLYQLHPDQLSMFEL